MRILLLLLLLSTPAQALEARRSPFQACGDKAAPGASAKLAEDTSALDSGRGWRRLMRAGRPGCAAVAEWLGRGAPGAGDRAAVNAAALLAARGEDAHLAAAAGVLGQRAVDVDLAFLSGLEARLVRLEPDEAARWSAVPDGVFRRALLPILAGHHSEGRWETLYGRPVWRERRLHQAEEGPAAHHVAAVDSILEQAAHRGEAAARVAEVLGRMLEEDAPGATAWAPALVSLLPLQGRDDQPSANRAARALGWGGASTAEAALPSLIEERRLEALDHWLDGVVAGLRAGRGSRDYLPLLERVAEAGLGGRSKRAEGIRARWGKKLAG